MDYTDEQLREVAEYIGRSYLCESPIFHELMLRPEQAYFIQQKLLIDGIVLVIWFNEKKNIFDINYVDDREEQDLSEAHQFGEAILKAAIKVIHNNLWRKKK